MLINSIQRKLAALVWHANIDAKFLDQYPNLQFVQRYGVGFDNIDIEACEKEKNTVLQ